MQKAIDKYMAWTNKPFTVDSKRLGEDPGCVVRSHNGKPRATDGPYIETQGVLGGFCLIEAAEAFRSARMRRLGARAAISHANTRAVRRVGDVSAPIACAIASAIFAPPRPDGSIRFA
jgi:hypothetical protein